MSIPDLLSGINRFFLAQASARNVLLLLGITIISFAMMATVITPAFQEATDGLRPFDLNRGISSEVMYQELAHYTARSRTIYLWFTLLDYVYPAAAAAFVALLWAWMFNRVPNRGYERLTKAGILGIPFIYALIDWLENAGFVFLILSYPSQYQGIAAIVGMLKRFKPFTALIVLSLTLVIAVVTLWLIWQRRVSTIKDLS
jgi:hypothetical protein